MLGRIAEWSKGPASAFLTGGRLTDEDYYALSKLARTVFDTNDLDHRAFAGGGDGRGVARRHRHRDLRRRRAREGDPGRGLDAEQEVPILHLRLRKAASRGAKIFVLHPRRTRLHDVAEHVLVRPGQEAYVLERMPRPAGDPRLGEARSPRLREAGEDGGRDRRPAAGRASRRRWSRSGARRTTGARFAFVTRRANDRGALRAGVHPALLPGGRRFSEAGERAQVEAVWGPLDPRTPGRDARRSSRRPRTMRSTCCSSSGVDPLRDFPDAALARRALENVPPQVVQSLELGALEPYADAFLPAAAFLEKDGHVTTWEGRGQRLRPVRDPVGISRPDWEIFAGLAEAMGGSLGFGSLEELQEELGGLLAPRELGERSTAWVGTGKPQWIDDLTLFTYPFLVDEGRLSEGATELKAALEEEPFVEIHPGDAEKRGISDGAQVRVTTEAGEAGPARSA